MQLIKGQQWLISRTDAQGLRATRYLTKFLILLATIDHECRKTRQ